MTSDEARAMWSRGDYGIVGDWIAGASRACLDGIHLDGAALLDIACGTGTVAIEAARRGARVVGLDLTPTMLEEAARRAHAAGVTVEWREGSFEDLSAYTGFDVATSAFGVIFARDAVQAARQMLGCLRPGGVAVVSGWAPGSVFGTTPQGLYRLMPELAAEPDITVWTRPEGVEALVAAAGGVVVDLREGSIEIAFASPQDAAERFRRWSGPWITLFDALAKAGTEDEGQRAVVEHLARHARVTADGIVLDAAYTIVRLQRPAASRDTPSSVYTP